MIDHALLCVHTHSVMHAWEREHMHVRTHIFRRTTLKSFSLAVWCVSLSSLRRSSLVITTKLYWGGKWVRARECVDVCSVCSVCAFSLSYFQACCSSPTTDRAFKCSPQDTVHDTGLSIFEDPQAGRHGDTHKIWVTFNTMWPYSHPILLPFLALLSLLVISVLLPRWSILLSVCICQI